MVPFSVLLSIYFKESPLFFSEAMTSIYENQSLKPDQIVLVKDGPLTSRLEDEINFWQEKLGELLTIVCLPQNIGLAAALNKGLLYCNYDLVARMDTDDISAPERFRLQLEFMQNYPDVSVLSGYIEEWNIDFSSRVSIRLLPLMHKDIVSFAKVRSPISHPACIFRKSVILEVGGYPDIYPEDHLLWIRIIQSGFKLANIPNVLLKMRTGEDFITRRGYFFLKGELKSYIEMYNTGFISFPQLLKTSLIRVFLRLSPGFVKVWLYKNFR